MRTHALGSTALQVSRLGFGSADFRGKGAYSGPPYDPEDAGRLLNAVLDAGIAFVDTSPCYGQCEDVIGRFASHRRDQFVLATKFACISECAATHDGNHLFTPENFRRNLERSLQRLRTDRIDVWQLHSPVSVEQVRLDDVQAAAEQARAEGKIVAWGVSPDYRTSEAFAAWDAYDTYQTNFSLLMPREAGNLQRVKRRGGGTIIRGSVAQGDPDEGGRGQPKVWARWHEAKLDELLPEGETRTTFLLRYALGHPDVDTVIVGMGSLAELSANIATAGRGPLPEDLCREARRRVEAAVHAAA